jgi:hypothetical protein
VSVPWGIWQTDQVSSAVLQMMCICVCLQTYTQGLDLDAMLETFLGGIASPEPPSTQNTPRPEPGGCHEQPRVRCQAHSTITCNAACPRLAALPDVVQRTP